MASIATVVAVLLVLAAAPARSVGDRREAIVSTQVASASHAYARALAIQADGKLVAVGSSDAAGRPGGFALARYTRKGILDGSFGRGGKVLTDFGSSGGAAAVVIQPDGKIVAAGSSSRSADRRDKEFALARYRRDGSLDASFGRGGKLLTSFGRYSRAVGVVLQGDGKLVAVGSSGTNSDTIGQLAVARYTPSGRLDASFGSGGKVLTSCGSSCYASRSRSSRTERSSSPTSTHASPSPASTWTARSIRRSARTARYRPITRHLRSRSRRTGSWWRPDRA